jgi:hypothetical protein
MAIPALEIEITADPTAADVGFKKIERSLDGLEKATRDYQTALANVNKAQQRGIITDKAAAAAIKEAERAHEEAAKAAARYSGAQVKARRGAVEMAGSMSSLTTVTRGGAGGIQNFGYQIQDFAVQVGAGTSASQALGQQLPQLLSGFGTLGVVMGTVAAIGIPLGSALLNVGGNAATLEEQLDALAEAMDGVNSAQDRFLTSARDLREEFGAQAEAAREVLAAQREIANLLAERALSAATADLAEQFGDLNAMVSDTGEVLRGGYEEVLRRILRTTDATANQAMELANALNGLSKAEGPEAQRAALERVKQALLEATGGVQDMDEETLKVYQSLLDAELAAARLAQLDISSNISTAADEADRLRENLWAAAALEQARTSGRYSGRGGDPRQFDTEGRLGGGFVPNQDIIDQANAILNPSRGRSSGGGGRAAQPDRIGALAQSLMTESELLENWRSESMTKLEDFNALELEALGGHAEAKLRIEEEYMQRLAAIRQAEQKTTLSGYGQLFGNLETVFKAGGDKMVGITKAFSIAQGLINSYRAYTEVLADPALIGRPFLRQALAASTLAAGLAQVSSIRSVSTSGGGGAPSASAASSAAAPAMPTQTVAINLQGDTFSRSSVEGLLEQIQSQLDRGGRLVFQ